MTVCAKGLFSGEWKEVGQRVPFRVLVAQYFSKRSILYRSNPDYGRAVGAEACVLHQESQ